MNEQTLGLSANWLNDGESITKTRTTGAANGALSVTSGGAVGQAFSGGGGVYGQTSGCYDSYRSYQYPWYYVYNSPAPRPIKLTMSEVDRLRKAAKTDDKLKAILSKFTEQIEIVVDFD